MPGLNNSNDHPWRAPSADGLDLDALQNRIEALDKELQKIGLKLIPLGATWNLGTRTNAQPVETLEIDTYKDHRMAMAFTPLAIPFGEVIIDDPAVVTKSYAGFWEDVVSLGFEVEKV